MLHRNFVGWSVYEFVYAKFTMIVTHVWCDDICVVNDDIIYHILYLESCMNFATAYIDCITDTTTMIIPVKAATPISCDVFFFMFFSFLKVGATVLMTPAHFYIGKYCFTIFFQFFCRFLCHIYLLLKIINFIYR